VKKKSAVFEPLAPAAGTPLYRAVKRSLLRAIETGQCQPGARLPSETALAKQLGVSIGTVRHAVDELVSENIVARQQGLGTFVATHTADRFLYQFFHVQRQDGLRESPRVDFLDFQKVPADAEVAEALGVHQGDPCVQIDNRLLLQGQAVIHDRLVIPLRIFKGITATQVKERPSTIYHLYQAEFGVTVVRARERARAIAADRTTARVLGLPVGTPLIQVHRIALTFGDKAVEYRISTLDTRRHEYVNLLARLR
jgi:GntR family transcriptional regulator